MNISRMTTPLARALAVLRCLAAAPGAIAVALPSAVAQPVDERLPACLACHGENGTSQNAEVPSLGAQQAFYVTVQLLMFRDRMRVAEPMNEMAKGLSDDDLRRLGELIAKLPPPRSPAATPDAARMQRGVALVQQHRCNFCHAANFAGQENVPRIANQREDYLVKALRGYKDNSRRGYDSQMADVIEPIADDEIRALAYFLAHAK